MASKIDETSPIVELKTETTKTEATVKVEPKESVPAPKAPKKRKQPTAKQAPDVCPVVQKKEPEHEQGTAASIASVMNAATKSIIEPKVVPVPEHCAYPKAEHDDHKSWADIDDGPASVDSITTQEVAPRPQTEIPVGPIQIMRHGSRYRNPRNAGSRQPLADQRGPREFQGGNAYQSYPVYSKFDLVSTKCEKCGEIFVSPASRQFTVCVKCHDPLIVCRFSIKRVSINRPNEWMNAVLPRSVVIQVLKDNGQDYSLLERPSSMVRTEPKVSAQAPSK
jgi:hypothetical protein